MFLFRMNKNSANVDIIVSLTNIISNRSCQFCYYFNDDTLYFW